MFKDYAKDFDAVTEKKGLRSPKVRRPALTTVGLLLLGWFILYGDASSRRPLMAGAFLSGLLFFLLASRAFQRVKPPIFPYGSEPATSFERIGLSASTSTADAVKRAMDAKKKMEVNGSLFMYQKWRSIWRRYALLMRGQAGRARLYLLLLLDYVVSLLVLAAAAVLFWAIFWVQAIVIGYWCYRNTSDGRPSRTLALMLFLSFIIEILRSWTSGHSAESAFASWWMFGVLVSLQYTLQAGKPGIREREASNTRLAEAVAA